MKNNWKPVVLIFLSTLFFLLPILAKTEIFLNRSNDLDQFFWPTFNYVKTNIIANHTIPLWNTLIFSGTPLLPDPQSPIFYLPNFIFLLVPLNVGFLISLVLHVFIGGVCVYFLAKTLKFNSISSMFCSFLYICTPRLFSYIEAGHYGLITSWAWIPLAVLATIKLARNPHRKWVLLLAISFVAIFLSHTITFLLTYLSVSLLYLYLTFQDKIKRNVLIIYFFLSTMIFLGLVSIVLIPQISWQNQTTRILLLQDQDIYPKWHSLKEFSAALLIPWNFLAIPSDNEKAIATGIFTTFLAFVGYLSLSKKMKIILGLSMGFLILISFNNISPFYSLLVKFPLYDLLRVSTRVWFIYIFIIIFLAGLGFKIIEKKNKNIAFILGLLSILEFLFISWGRINLPITQVNYAPQSVYQFFSEDKDIYRVFCVTRCLSQKDASLNNVQLVEGYNTLQQLNYFKESWELMGGYWNYYTLAIPPIGSYENLKPDAKALGDFNTKYVVSAFIINDNLFREVNTIEGFHIYLNTLYRPRAYYVDSSNNYLDPATITSYSTNEIKLNIDGQQKKVVLADVYSPGWVAYTQNQDKIVVQQRPNTTRLVDIPTGTKSLMIKYQPESYKYGVCITSVTLVVIFIIMIYGVKPLYTIYSFLSFFLKDSKKTRTTPKTRDS